MSMQKEKGNKEIVNCTRKICALAHGGYGHAAISSNAVLLCIMIN
jgi:hypothetical protein